MGGGGVYSFVVLALINSVFLLLEICIERKRLAREN
jgi:hypothetical protein